MADEAHIMHITIFVVLGLIFLYYEYDEYMAESPPKKMMHPHHVHLKDSIEAVIMEKKEEKNYLKCAKGGFVRGAISGLVLGGPHAALINGAVFGCINPILHYYGH